MNFEGVDSASRGLVGDTVFAVLPNIKPIHTFMITIGLQCVRHIMRYSKSILINPLDISNEVMDDADVQIVRGLLDIMRIYIIYVWMACPRESCTNGIGTIKVFLCKFFLELCS